MEQEKEIVKYAKFVEGQKPKNIKPEKFTLALSVDNKNLTGKAFKACMKLLNENVNKVKELEIIISCYLQRHYKGEEATDDILQNKLDEILPRLEKLDNKISITIIPWKNLYSEEFNKASQFVAELYENSLSFKKKIDNTAKSYISKKDLESAKNYLLEESAAMAIPNKDFRHFLYPSTKISPPIAHILKLKNPQVAFHGYSIFDADKSKVESKKMKKQEVNYNSSSDESGSSDEEKAVRELCNVLADTFIKVGIYNPQDQANVFLKFSNSRSKDAAQKLMFNFDTKEITSEHKYTEYRRNNSGC